MMWRIGVNKGREGWGEREREGGSERGSEREGERERGRKGKKGEGERDREVSTCITPASKHESMCRTS